MTHKFPWRWLTVLIGLSLIGGQLPGARSHGELDKFAYLPLIASSQTIGSSLRFHGNGQNDLDRVKIPIDPPVPADLGATDLTLEFWLKATDAENASGYATCDANDGWITAHIIFDRDVYFAGDYGDYGVALAAGKIVFGVNNGSTGTTLCGQTNVADGVWHHIALTRRLTGPVRLYIDGQLDASANTSVTGDISYRDNRATAYPNSDPFLVIGAEKHDAGSSYPSFSGWIDEVRLSTEVRYTGHFSRPIGPFVPDGSTAALYHLDEGSGDVIHDALTTSPGTRRYGGQPAGPEWSIESPF